MKKQCRRTTYFQYYFYWFLLLARCISLLCQLFKYTKSFEWRTNFNSMRILMCNQRNYMLFLFFSSQSWHMEFPRSFKSCPFPSLNRLFGIFQSFDEPPYCSKGETKPTSRIRIRNLKYINWLLDLNSMEQHSLMDSQRMHFPWFSICESE